MDTPVYKILLVATTLYVSLARCEPPVLSNQYGVPGNFAGPQGNGQYQQGVTNSYGAPLGDGGHGQHDEQQDYVDSQPKSYEFGYAVKDAASGNDFGRREQSDGETVRGEYRVQLPDGRTQIVTYTADWRTGFHADVRYEGVAQYPDQYNNANQGYNNNGQAAYDYAAANNNIDSGYNAAGNQGGYNNYQGASAATNNYNPGYNYQFGSNSIDNGYAANGGYSGGGHGGGGGGGGGSFAASISPPPQPTYGVPFH